MSESHGVTLTQAQKNAIKKALREGKPYTLKLSPKSMIGGEMMSFTGPQISKLAGAHQRGKPVEIKLSASQLRKMAQEHAQAGMGFWSDAWDSVKKVGKKAAKYVAPVVGDAIRATAPMAVDIAADYFLPGVAGQFVADKASPLVKKATSKEVLGFGMKSSKGVRLAPRPKRGSGITTTGNGIYSTGAQGGNGIYSTGGAMSKEQVQHYYASVAQPTSLDGRRMAGRGLSGGCCKCGH